MEQSIYHYAPCTRLEIDVGAADGPGDLEAVGHGQERRRRRHRRHHRRRRHGGDDDHLCSRLSGRGESLAGRVFRRFWVKKRPKLSCDILV